MSLLAISGIASAIGFAVRHYVPKAYAKVKSWFSKEAAYVGAVAKTAEAEAKLLAVKAKSEFLKAEAVAQHAALDEVNKLLS